MYDVTLVNMHFKCSIKDYIAVSKGKFEGIEKHIVSARKK